MGTPTPTSKNWKERFRKKFVLEGDAENFSKVGYYDDDSGFDYWRADVLESFIDTLLLERDAERNSLEEELKKLYNSEINVRIDCFWDGGWRVSLGDEMNGYESPEWDSCELNEIVPTIRELALKYYPQSTYSKSLLNNAQQGE